MTTGNRVDLIDLVLSDVDRIAETAALLRQAFHGRQTMWDDMEVARDEVLQSLAPGRVSRVALDGAGRVVGWIGGQPQYEGAVWELHPLAVAVGARRRGIGRALVENLEAEVASRGALTLWLGSDDELIETSLGGADLYDELPAQLARFQSGGAHPHPFYERLGFCLVGVMPDANGRGKPDLFFAKRVGS